ncbi:tetratricopeptide repeat protein [Streptomyces sp. NBC_00343]|uniref:tetratricopeptide repeat protein n=1 Tax=Streptomyces sp. NBC_00343 TaxID=2975719 RepID=UPI002E2935A3|nr:tetratricopeptide repeat protein [Streptomyces sp. NBC_00343]
MDSLPPYVARDVDDVLNRVLAEAGESGGMVLLTGDSTAGKTRTAYEAMRRVLPGHLLWAPPRGADLRKLPALVEGQQANRLLLWLDDLEGYMHSQGLEPNILAQLSAARVVVLATLRESLYDLYRPGSEHAAISEKDFQAQLVAQVGSRVLNMAMQVEIERTWSADELLRTAHASDARLQDALANHGPFGVAEYLAAGPLLWQEWRGALRAGGRPRGHALVAAAIDLARAGMIGPLPHWVVIEAHYGYLQIAAHLRPEEETLNQAVRWATVVRLGSTSLLVPNAAAGTWRVFDYLVDEAERKQGFPAVPELVWEIAEREATGSQRRGVAFSAHAAGRKNTAERLFRAMRENGEENGRTLGVILAQQNRYAEAEPLLRSAVEEGDFIAPGAYGLLLTQLGRIEEAEPLLRWEAENGLADKGNVALLLGDVLSRQGRTSEAEEQYRIAAAKSSSYAPLALGSCLLARDRCDEAEPWLRKAAEAGNQGGASRLAIALIRLGRSAEAEEWLQVALDVGVTLNFVDVGHTLDEQGHPELAEKWLRVAAYAGADAAIALAMLLVGQGRFQEAEPWARKAAASGDVEAVATLGAVLTGQLRLREAEPLLRRAAEANNAKGTMFLSFLWDEAEPTLRLLAEQSDEWAVELGLFLVSQHQFEEAEPWLRRAAKAEVSSGDRTLAGILGEVLQCLGRVDEAASWLRAAADRGSMKAAHRLGSMLLQQGQDEAEHWLRRAAEAGDMEAAYELGFHCFLAADRLDEAERWLRMGSTHIPQARAWLGAVLIGLGREHAPEGEELLRHAAESGTDPAPFLYGDYLHAVGRPEDAEPWLRLAANAGNSAAADKLCVVLQQLGRQQVLEETQSSASEPERPSI